MTHEEVELYRCPLHGWMEDSGLEGSWLLEGDGLKSYCRIALGDDETCGVSLEGPYKVKMEVQDG